MSNAFLKTTLALLASLTAILAVSPTLRAQSRCVSQEEIKKMVAAMESGETASLNEKLGKELVRLKGRYFEKYLYAADADFRSRSLNLELTKVREKNDARLCEILKQFGWPTINLTGENGAEAALYLLQNSLSLPFQADMLPVVSVAAKKGYIRKDEAFATFYDRLRVWSGQRQVFGTQTVRKGDFLYLLPLLSEKQVDELRRDFNMPSLADSIRALELRHRTPVLPTRGEQANTTPDDLPDTFLLEGLKTAPVAISPEQNDNDDDVLRVDTSLVSLPVFVYDPSNNPLNLLAEKNFEVYEDGRRQDIRFFSAADAPFDLILLIDLSGSTQKMIDLIKSATLKFIERKRPGDRLGIVVFADEPAVVSPLTDNREELLGRAQSIEGQGRSRVWDALKFTLENMFGERSDKKRQAVVFLTDGADNSLEGMSSGSKTSFYKLFDTLKQRETSIFPIYLDTESQFPHLAQTYRSARNTLALLANETGGRSYKAKKIEDLDGVYSDVLYDLTRIYTIGYIPSNEKRDGAWRTIEVKVPGHTELSVKTKAGYYAK